MTIIPNGTKVNIIEPGIKGMIQSCSISGSETPIIEYRVIYWINGTRKGEWVYDWEVEIFIDTSKKAGMVNYETDLKTT